MTNKMFNEKNSVLYQTRYCAQEDFTIALCTHRSVRKLEPPFNLNNYRVSKQLGVFFKKKYNSKIVASGTDLFLISESRKQCTVEKYSESSGNKNILPPLIDRRFNFCVCSFMHKIYVIGGCRKTLENIYTCMCYDIKNYRWNYIASIIESRYYASCAVFKGKIVVTGGILRNNFFKLNSSESYCFHENSWKKFPNMLINRCLHATVSMNNKLFVIGGNYSNDCEVFDSVTNKFVIITNLIGINHFVNAVSVGYKIYICHVVRGGWQSEDKNEMWIFNYNDKQNALIQESKLQLDFKMVHYAKMSKK